LILAGVVFVDGKRAAKAGDLVDPDAELSVQSASPYVSRGGYKLAHALDRFAVDVSGLTVADVGASTGGFTDVLLQRGAARVYAIDVGRGQLHWRLRTDPRVRVLDRTNVRFLEALPELAALATIDVSFISLRLVVPAVLRLLRAGSSMIVLVKPQFEAGREDVGRGGVVRSPGVHQRVLETFATWLPEFGLGLAGLVVSPIKGPAGNIEFLGWLVPARSDLPGSARLVEAAMTEAHHLQ
jgi:23S rRNA (cytidine1920-2'-O)/16S rRNA (cytidine1409-2'-O)-methyltransferase